MNDLRQNYQRVLQRIEAASREAGLDCVPNLLAVSKKQSVAKIQTIHAAGQLDFGESYVQEAVAKIAELDDLPLVWHFIGPIQSNKSKQIATHFAWVHSVDRMKILRRLESQRPEGLAPLNVLLQIKIGDEASKQGADWSAIQTMADWLESAQKLRFRGLMCIPPPSENSTTQRAYFDQAKQCYDVLAEQHASVDTLSMGMSSDLEAAVSAGSTVLRIGTDVFGQRK